MGNLVGWLLFGYLVMIDRNLQFLRDGVGLDLVTHAPYSLLKGIPCGGSGICKLWYL